MKYRAVAIGLSKDDHPVQNMSNSLTVIFDWAKMIAEKEKVSVAVYSVSESLMQTIHPFTSEPMKPFREDPLV